MENQTKICHPNLLFIKVDVGESQLTSNVMKIKTLIIKFNRIIIGISDPKK